LAIEAAVLHVLQKRRQSMLLVKLSVLIRQGARRKEQGEVKPKSSKKPKKAKLSTLIKKADVLASTYIRQKYADHAGNVTCISCDTVLHWTAAHSAHYIERSKKTTRWLEENLHPACPSCNVYRKEFHMREYTFKMIDWYGRDFVNELREMAKKTPSLAEVRKLAEEAIKYYVNKDELNEMDASHEP
jgi:hypothetical protein